MNPCDDKLMRMVVTIWWSDSVRCVGLLWRSRTESDIAGASSVRTFASPSYITQHNTAAYAQMIFADRGNASAYVIGRVGWAEL